MSTTIIDVTWMEGLPGQDPNIHRPPSPIVELTDREYELHHDNLEDKLYEWYGWPVQEWMVIGRTFDNEIKLIPSGSYGVSHYVDENGIPY